MARDASLDRGAMSTTTAREKIAKRRNASLVTLVRDAVEDMIIRGDLTSGTRINESALAEALSVSRGPIREACRSLEQAGLVVNVANQGAYVREVTFDEARALYEVRIALVGMAAELVVERADDDELQVFLQKVDAMDETVAEQDTKKYYQQNIDFHNSFVRCAKNEPLLVTYQSIVKQLHLSRQRGLVVKANLEVSNAEHRQIAEAAKARDGARCSAAARAHIEAGWRRYELAG